MKDKGHRIILLISIFIIMVSYLFWPNQLIVEDVDEIEEQSEELIINISPQDSLKELPLPISTLDIPFTPQAPMAEWDNPIFQEGCEEASSLMTVYWALGKELNQDIARQEIIAMANYQEEKLGFAEDTSADDTAIWLIKGYFRYDKIEVKKEIQIKDIIKELKLGRAVIVPADGQLLGNPYFTAPGPERHNLIIRGYDPDKREFITNDSGTKRGELYRYNEDVLYKAIRDYPSGYHKPITSIEKTMIVIWK
ncbi:MAG: C39 family peptidase [Patescibacteria group bacterium]|nr:C39 family peptidase [Patescibacteria group bacterium]